MAKFRRTFTATIRPLEQAGRFELAASRGCFRRNVHTDGALKYDEKENRELRVNFGDTLLVSDADLAVDEVAMVSVTGILTDGKIERHLVKVVAGELAAREHRVFVQPALCVLKPSDRGSKRTQRIDARLLERVP